MIENLPELPDSWIPATLSQVGELNRRKSKHRPRNAPHLYGGEYPFIQTGDVINSLLIHRRFWKITRLKKAMKKVL